ncbi:MAG: nucleoside hydrolase [Anaerolineae bacterium]
MDTRQTAQRGNARKALVSAVLILLGLVVLALISGPVLNALGLPVYCIESGAGRLRLVRCGGDAAAVPLEPGSAPALAVDAQPTLIDTDMAADDWMAILYLLNRPDVDVRAITVTGAGEAHCGPGVQNALNLAALAGRPDIPVSCGRETPLAGDHVFPPSWRERVDALAGVTIPASTTPPSDLSAAELIAETARGAGGDLEIITLGPLTNLAEALLADPALADSIEQVFIMGGAFDVPGNLASTPDMGIENSAAEWNIYVDPRAAAVVLESGVPVTFVPLDACSNVLLDEAFYNRLGGDRASPEAEFVYRVLTANFGFVQSGTYYFWDPLTAVLAVDSSLGTFETQPVVVIQGEGPESGATRVDEAGRPAQIAVWADGERFTREFLDTLNGRAGD